MEDFYHKLNKKLSNEKTLDKVNPEQLWSKIVDELDDDAALSPVPNPKGNMFKKWGAILVLLMLFSTVGYYFYNSKKEQILTESTNSAPSNIERNSDTKSTKIRTHQTQLFQADKRAKDDNIVIENTARKTVEDTRQFNKKNAIKTKSKSNENELVISPIIIEKTYNKITPKPNENQKGKTLFIKEEKEEKVNLLENKLITEKRLLKHIPTHNEKVMARNSKNLKEEKQTLRNEIFLSTLAPQTKEGIPRPVPVLPTLVAEKIHVPSKSKQLWAVEIATGMNYTISSFQKNSNDTHFGQELDTFYTPNTKYQFSIGVQRKIHQNLHLFFGCEYGKNGQQFNIVQEKDSSMNHASTGIIIPARATRTVRHYNSVSYLSFPLMLGWSKRYNRWEYGLRVGGSLHWRIQQQGKTVSPNHKILTYNNSNEKLPFKKIAFSYQVHPFVNYDITGNFAVQFRPFLSYQNNGTSPLWKVKHYTWQGGANIGLVWKW